MTKANNDQTTAATYTENGQEAPIEVERVVSKITFRHKAAANNFEKIGQITDGKNLYTIEEQKYKTSFAPSNFWYLNPNTNIYDYLTNLYKAYDDDNTEYWVYVANDGSTTFYTDTKETYTGDLADSKDVQANIVTLVDEDDVPTVFYYDGTKAENGTENYYVQLQRYALVNLSKNVYYIRHTSDLNGTTPTTNHWGYVGSNNYIVEPKTVAKSNMTFVTTPALAWPDNTTVSDYFDKDFLAVTSRIASDDFSDFISFATDDEGSVNNVITPTGGVPAEAPTYKEADNVGTLMGYCLENSVHMNNSNALTNTGVIFEAKMFDNNGNVVSPMFKWNNNLYPSLEALIFATAPDGDKEKSPFRFLTDEKYGTEITKESLKSEHNIDVYEDGRCYYFSAEIKHFDYGTATKGAMEYAIMRNNIYSLAVDNVNGFGFSSMDIQSGVLNNSTTEQEKVYLTMKAKILPWIVRFNDIEF